MATRTSVGNGAWSAAGTWDTGVPLDGDDVVIASGHTVTFDVDQSAFTTGVGITITGTLNHTTTTGVYVLKAKTGASIVGAGTWNIGTSGTPIPFAAKHTITGAAGWYVDGNAGLTMTVYGAEPSIEYVKLSGNEAINQTELSVDTDVTGDIWSVGDKVAIVENGISPEYQSSTIASGGIAPTTITLTNSLTLAKNTGAYIILLTRNVSIVHVGTVNTCIYRVGSTSNKLSIGSAAIVGASKYFFESCHYMNISGGAFYNSTWALRSCNNVTVSGGVWTNNYTFGVVNNLTISGGAFLGNLSVIESSTYNSITGGLFASHTYVVRQSNQTLISGGTFYKCNAPLSIGTGNTITGGTFISNDIPCSEQQYLFLSGATFITSNQHDLDRCSGKLFGVTLTSSTEHNGYTTNVNNSINCQSEDHDGVDGALKAWCKGGVVTSQVTVKPDGYTQAYLLDPESATYPVFFTKQFSVEPGKTVDVVVQLRKDASMTYLPRVYLMASIGNPLAGATPVDTFTMTDSTNTWESDTFTIANSTDYDQDYTLYFVAQNATDNAYAAYDITTEGGGSGGGISRSRLLGGV